MKIPEGYIPKSLYTEKPESVEVSKAEKAEHELLQQMENPKPAPITSSIISAKKSELAIAGQAVAASIQWKSGPDDARAPIMQEGSSGSEIKGLQERLNIYREEKGLPAIKQDGIFGKET